MNCSFSELEFREFVGKGKEMKLTGVCDQEGFGKLCPGVRIYSEGH